jgi:hypothetical protein
MTRVIQSRHGHGAEVADVIKNNDPADFIGAGAYVALHVREEHVDGEAVGDFDGGNHADREEDGQAAPIVRQARTMLLRNCSSSTSQDSGGLAAI